MDQDMERNEISALVKNYSESGVILDSMLSCSEATKQFSYMDSEAFISRYNLLHEIIIRSQKYNKLYDDEFVKNVESKLGLIFEETKKGLVKIIHQINELG